MKMRCWTVHVILTTWMAVCSCQRFSQNDEALRDTFVQLPMDLLQVRLSDTAPDENLFFSPMSITMALGLAWMGARGNTAREIGSFFRFNDTDPVTSDGKFAFSRLMQSIQTGNGRKYTLEMANKAYLYHESNGTRQSREYAEALRQYFASDAEWVRFDEPTRQKINAWVEGVTKNKIKNLIPPGIFDPLFTRAVLVNGIYFKADWQTEFAKELTEPSPFYLDNGQSYMVDMMTSGFFETRSAFLSNLQASAVELKYKGGEVRMLIVVPTGQGSMETLRRGLDGEALVSLYENDLQVSSKVKVLMPKFRLDTTFPVKDVLRKMGVEDMFKWGSANFSGISQEIIYVTDIFHKAYIEVDEKGSEAAAATGLVFFTRSGLDSPRIIVVNRPFLFFITLHAPNADLRQAPQAILFAGRVSKPPPRLSSSA